jgi:thioesterase domain-containing protein
LRRGAPSSGNARRLAAHERRVLACDTRAVTTLDALGRELQATWLREIPLATALAIEVASCSRDELAVRAPLAPNRNLHGTAFAGSLFSICVLTGWGAVWLALRQHAAEGLIVVADSRIQYRKAVNGDLLCRCRPDLDALERGLADLAASGRASLPLVCTLDQDGRRAVTFEGEYVVHKRKEPQAHA